MYTQWKILCVKYLQYRNMHQQHAGSNFLGQSFTAALLPSCTKVQILVLLLVAYSSVQLSSYKSLSPILLSCSWHWVDTVYLQWNWWRVVVANLVKQLSMKAEGCWFYYKYWPNDNMSLDKTLTQYSSAIMNKVV